MTAREPTTRAAGGLDLTLSDLRFTAVVTATYRRCKFRHPVDVAAVAPRVGLSSPARALEPRLRCLQCAALACDISVRVTAPNRGAT